jgi:hypothetical protein
MLKKYKMTCVFEAFQWDGTLKQLLKYKWLRNAIDKSELEVNVCTEYTEELNIPKNIFYADDEYIVPGDYIVYYRKIGSIILYKKKDFDRNMIEVKEEYIIKTNKAKQESYYGYGIGYD